MSAEPPTTVGSHEPSDEAWLEIEALVDHLAQLSRSETPVSSFYRELVDRMLGTLAAPAAAVWLFDRTGSLQQEYQSGYEQLQLAPGAGQEQHDDLLRANLEQHEVQTFAPQSGAGASTAANPTPFLLLLCPLWCEGERLGLIELVQRPATHPATVRGNERLLAMVGELAVDYHRQQWLKDYRERVVWSDRLDQFTQRIHSQLDLNGTAFEAANEGRRLIGCDRVSVAVRQRGRLRLKAISGVDTFDPRANAVRHLERLIALVVRTGESLWYTGDWSDLPPELEGALRDYLDEGHARTVIVTPLQPEEEEQITRLPAAAMVIERFDAEVDEGMASRVVAVTKHASQALRNAEEYQTLPLLGVSRVIRGAAGLLGWQRMPKTLLAFTLLVVLTATLILVPAELKVTARGSLEPENEHILFAPRTAHVARVAVEHDQLVHKGQLLLELQDRELQQRWEANQSEVSAARELIETLGISRLEGVDNERDPQVANLPARQRLALEQYLNAQREGEELKKEREELIVYSARSGRVVTWEIEEVLAENRPVRYGDVLMRIADESGPWILKLAIPDDRSGPVLRAGGANGADLDVTFKLFNDPAVSYEGRLRKLASSTSLDQEGKAVVNVTVEVDREQIRHLRPGTTVVARIHCGQHSLGYVWLHDVIDFVRTQLFF